MPNCTRLRRLRYVVCSVKDQDRYPLAAFDRDECDLAVELAEQHGLSVIDLTDGGVVRTFE